MIAIGVSPLYLEKMNNPNTARTLDNSQKNCIFCFPKINNVKLVTPAKNPKNCINTNNEA